MANKKLSAIIQIGGAVLGSLASAVGSSKSKLQEIGGAISAVKEKQKELNRTIREQTALGASGSSSRIGAARQELASLDQQLSKLRRINDQIRANDKAVSANLANRSRIRSKIGETLAIGAAIFLPAGAAARRSMDFNYNMQAIGNTADMTKSQVSGLGAAVLKISDDTGQGAKTTQDAIGFLVAAGMDVGLARDSMLAIGRTSTATAAQIEDVSRAAFTLNDTMSIQPEGMQNALDILVQAGKEGNFEFKAMAANIPQLGAAFKSLKMQGAEAVGTMGAALQIARKGAGDEAEAANNLRNFLAKILSPETLRKADKLGGDLYGIISGAQARGENPFEAAVAEINRITNGGDQKLLGELFQDMQVQNFLRPMLQNLDEYQRVKAAAMGADGVVDRDFLKMQETTKQQWNEMAGAAERAAIAVGSSLEPALGGLFRTMRPVLNSVAEFVNAHPKIASGVVITVGALATLNLGILATRFAFTFLRGGILSMIGMALRTPLVAAIASGAMRVLAGGVMFAGRAVLWLGRALLLNPIGLAITAIAGGVYLVYKYWEPLKSFFTNLWADITATARGAFDWIMDKIDAVGSGWKRTKEFFGLGDDEEAATSDATLPAPAMAASRGGSQTAVTNTNHFNIQQLPGENSDALADRIMRRLDQRNAIRGRSMMTDMLPQ